MRSCVLVDGRQSSQDSQSSGDVIVEGLPSVGPCGAANVQPRASFLELKVPPTQSAAMPWNLRPIDEVGGEVVESRKEAMRVDDVAGLDSCDGVGRLDAQEGRHDVPQPQFLPACQPSLVHRCCLLESLLLLRGEQLPPWHLQRSVALSPSDQDRQEEVPRHLHEAPAGGVVDAGVGDDGKEEGQQFRCIDDCEDGGSGE